MHMLIRRIPQSRESTPNSEFGRDEHVEIPGALVRICKKVAAPYLILVVPGERQPQKTREAVANLGREAQLLVLKASCDDSRGAGKLCSDRGVRPDQPGMIVRTSAGEGGRGDLGNRLGNQIVADESNSVAGRDLEESGEKQQTAVQPS